MAQILDRHPDRAAGDRTIQQNRDIPAAHAARGMQYGGDAVRTDIARTRMPTGCGA
jgi:hypothetical protein